MQFNSSDSSSVNVGIIQYAEHEALSSAREGFVEALEEAGYKEGENLTIDLQNAQGDQANLQTMVEKLAGKNDLNFAIATPAFKPCLMQIVKHQVYLQLSQIQLKQVWLNHWKTRWDHDGID